MDAPVAFFGVPRGFGYTVGQPEALPRAKPQDPLGVSAPTPEVGRMSLLIRVLVRVHDVTGVDLQKSRCNLYCCLQLVLVYRNVLVPVVRSVQESCHSLGEEGLVRSPEQAWLAMHTICDKHRDSTKRAHW
jgi:hypothetical protein